MNIQVCRDTSDAIALYIPQRLFLKPCARLTISVQIPPLKVHGKSISNWELMEKLRKIIQPESFSFLKPTRNTTDLIRFEAELEKIEKLERVVSRLDDRTIQLSSYPDPLKVRASEAKSDFPSRHSWDAFFRDAPDMDEMKPGERPDTIHIMNLPIQWFVSPHELDMDSPPSESIFRKVFDKFGKIRYVDVPAADPFRMEMKSHMRGILTPATEASLYFEGYIQFNEYVSFVRAMDALRGMKLLRKKDDGLAEWVSIKVDFDKTKHMTEAAIKRRSIVRERLIGIQRAKQEQVNENRQKALRKEEKERQKKERAELDKLEKMREREERRKKKQLAKLMKDGVDVNNHIADEEKKLTKAQRKLQSVRLIEELFKRIELRPRTGVAVDKRRSAHDSEARDRLVSKMIRDCERDLDLQRDRLQQALDGRIIIRSALDTKNPRPRSRSRSTSSISSKGGSPYHKKIKSERMNTPEREELTKSAAFYSGMLPYGYPYPQFAPPPGYPPYGQNMYYPVRGVYYPPPVEFGARGVGGGGGGPRWGGPRGGRGRGRALYRGGPRIPYFEGPNASQEYYKYFKRLTEKESVNEHDDRHRSRSRSRRRSYTYSRSRSRSRSRRRSRHRSYSRSSSRSRSRRSRSKARYSRSRSRRARSRHARSASTHSRSKSRRSKSKSRSRSRRSKSRGSRDNARSSKHTSRERGGSRRRSKTPKDKSASPKERENGVRRSKSWSLPKDGQVEKSWSKSPSQNNPEV